MAVLGRRSALRTTLTPTPTLALPTQTPTPTLTHSVSKEQEQKQNKNVPMGGSPASVPASRTGRLALRLQLAGKRHLN
eukprot:7356814-Lingulodinium_polyedra.AAC.1